MPNEVLKTKRRPYLVRIISARPRLVISILFALLCAVFLPNSMAQRTVTRAILAWNAGAGLYLILAFRMMFWSSLVKMHSRAKLEDEGQILILVLVVVSVFSSLASIVVELAVVRNLQGLIRYEHMALAGISIATSWTFTHVMFALHYAHDYYLEIAKGRPGGLVFPGAEEPDYSDFLYFSFIIGTSAQTADVSFSSRRMRRTGMVHSVLAFFFNTTLLALTINIASGLL